MRAQAGSSRSTVAAKSSEAEILAAMAYRREDFKNNVEEHVGGALLEFYKARLAEKNGETKWVAHWDGEVRALLERALVAALLHSIRGFSDRRKGFAEATAAIRAADAGNRRAAVDVVKRDFGLAKVKHPLADDDTAAFWRLVDAAAESALGG